MASIFDVWMNSKLINVPDWFLSRKIVYHGGELSFLATDLAIDCWPFLLILLFDIPRGHVQLHYFNLCKPSNDFIYKCLHHLTYIWIHSFFFFSFLYKYHSYFSDLLVKLVFSILAVNLFGKFLQVFCFSSSRKIEFLFIFLIKKTPQKPLSF